MLRKQRLIRTILGSAALLGSLWVQPLFANSGKYPERAITMVVPWGAGGVTDIAGRIVAELLTDEYGVPVVVENRPGVGGIMGIQHTAEAKPDGYTLMLSGLGGNVIPPATIKDLPLDIENSFVPIARVAEFVNVLVVNGKSPFETVGDLLDYANENEAEALSFGSHGVGSSSHLTTEFFSQRENLKFLHVPYKGSSEISRDLLNKNLDFAFTNIPSVLSLIQDGSLKALAVTSNYRSRHLPDVPTMEESGLKDFDITSWLGVYGPAGMPEEIVQKLGTIIAEKGQQEKYSNKLVNVGFEPMLGDSEEFSVLNQEELKKWRQIAAEANVNLTFSDN